MFRRKKQAATVPDLEDSWSVLDGTLDDQPLIVRLNTGVQQLVGDDAYGIQIGVAVPLNEPDDRGMPRQDDMQALAAFEDDLLAAANGRAVLVAVVTTGGMREFVLYTSGGGWIDDFHTDLRAALPSHEVQVIAQHDPGWDVYRSFTPVD